MVMLFLFFIYIFFDFYNYFFLFSLFFLFLMSYLGGSFFSFYFDYDFFSSGLIFLSCLILIIMIFSIVNYINMSFNFFNLFFFILLMFYFLFFCFCFSNYFIFYFFFEFLLVPIFFIIMGWGGMIERLQAGFYMFIYTMLAALPFFLFLLFYYFNYYSFIFSYSLYLGGSFLGSYWWFFIIMVFLVKLPVFFVHLWLPKAHVEAPLVGSIVLAGVLLKLGGYGILKSFFFSLNEFFFSNYFLISLSLVGSFLISFFCLRQVDMKMLIAYSSVVHMGFVLLSLFNFYWGSVWGMFMMMLSHGICSSGMFFVLNCYYERFFSRSVLLIKGGLLYFSVFSFWWFLFSIFNMSFPPSFNFISEFLILFNSLWFSFSFFLFFFLLFMFSGFYSVFNYYIVHHGISSILSYVFTFFYKDYLILIVHVFPISFIFLCLIYF